MVILLAVWRYLGSPYCKSHKEPAKSTLQQTTWEKLFVCRLLKEEHRRCAMAEKDQSNDKAFLFPDLYLITKEPNYNDISSNYESSIGYKVHVSFDNTVTRPV